MKCSKAKWYQKRNHQWDYELMTVDFDFISCPDNNTEGNHRSCMRCGLTQKLTKCSYNNGASNITHTRLEWLDYDI